MISLSEDHMRLKHSFVLSSISHACGRICGTNAAALPLAAGGIGAGLLAGLLAGQVSAQQPPPQSPEMTFFVTSKGTGRGGDLGGLEGADAHCQALGTAAGAGSRNWRAYLSTQPTASAEAINARDRIGPGPWQNFAGVVVATDLEHLHSNENGLGDLTSLTERGTRIPTMGFSPNYHDILTGSDADGRALPSGEDRTCANWTSSGAGHAIVGHLNKSGLHDNESSRSWVSSHPTRGCGLPDLLITAGAGLFYCFAER
jgi:hypothetical protein